MQNLKIWAFLAGVTVFFWSEAGHCSKVRNYKKIEAICASAVRNQERQHAIPPHLLSAISKVESGRWNTEKQENIAWPWTVTSVGSGKFFDTKNEAVAEVEFLRTNGVQNIDVGCMQINLAAHANAFETIEDAFDPIANVAYGAHYLKIMHQRTGNWLKAAGGYHSMTPHLSAKYQKKVVQAWNKLLGKQKLLLKALNTKNRTKVTPLSIAAPIDYARIQRLNQVFRQRNKIATEKNLSHPVISRTTQRLKQIAAWRGGQSRGEAFNILARAGQAERAKRHKRE